MRRTRLIPTQPVIVIGGGISGLACAFHLQRAGVPVVLLEQASRAGGVISTVQQDGFTFDLGPQSFLSTPALTELVQSLGIEGELLQAPSSAPRFILAGGKLHPAPMSPPALVKSALVGARTKFRLMREPMSRTSPPAADESVADFVRRKFGADLLDNLAAPFVSGVYAGDAEKISLRAAFPQVYEWERDHGSVIRGAMKSRDPNKPRSTLCAFRGGMNMLPAALGSCLAGSVQLNTRVEALRKLSAGSGSQFEVRLLRDGQPETVQAAAVIVAAPAYVAARLMAGVAPAAAEPLLQIDYAPVAVVNLVFRRADVGDPLHGFGFLVSRREQSQILGTVFTSSLFPGRVPNDCVALTSFAGGSLNRSIVERDDAGIAAIVEQELAGLLGIGAAPVVRLVSRQARAIPQYNLGHRGRLDAIHAAVGEVAGLFVAGNYFTGPAIGACAENGQQTAGRVIEFLSTR